MGQGERPPIPNPFQVSYRAFFDVAQDNELTYFERSGMAPFIRAVLSNLVGEEEANKIDIVANDAIIYPDGRWEIKFRHPTRCVRCCGREMRRLI